MKSLWEKFKLNGLSIVIVINRILFGVWVSYGGWVAGQHPESSFRIFIVHNMLFLGVIMRFFNLFFFMVYFILCVSL